MSNVSMLRAMARNYEVYKHQWDKLDTEACLKAANEIEQLQARVASLRAEVERWKTISVCEACAELPAVFQYIEGMEKQLAIAEAQNARLEEAWNAIEINSEECLDFDECTAMLVPLDDYNAMSEALSLPASRETLDAYVAEIQAFGNTAKHLLSELLAVLLGDGGHHEDKVGTVQAVEDAMQVFYKRIQQRDLTVSALKQSREALRLPCDRWNKTQFEIVQSAIASIDSAIKESEV